MHRNTLPLSAPSRRRALNVVASVSAAVLATALAACSSNGASPNSSAISNRSAPSSASDTERNTNGSGPTAALSSATGATAEVGWRGATVSVPSGWRKAVEEDTALCLLPAASPTRVCQALGATGGARDWLLLYASERSAVPGAPADPLTLDGADMNFWMYNGVDDLPCDQWARNQRVDKGNKTIDGRVAYYGKWLVTCSKDQGGQSFIAQRWLLPRSRLGVVSYALNEASAASIFQMIATLDLEGYEPTSSR